MIVAWAVALLLVFAGPALSASVWTLSCVVESGGSAYTVYGTSSGPPFRTCDVGCTVTTVDGGTRSFSCQGVGLNSGDTDLPLCSEGPPGPGFPYTNPILDPTSSCQP
jgi:hypothetical protein